METANESTQTENQIDEWEGFNLFLLLITIMAMNLNWSDEDRVKHFAASPEFPEVAGDCLRDLLHNLNADNLGLSDVYGVNPVDKEGNLKPLEQVFQELKEKEINWQEMEDGK